MTTRRLATGLLGLLGLVGVLLLLAASPSSAQVPPFQFPDFGGIFAQIFAAIQRILEAVFASLCSAIGGTFCSS